MSKPVHAAVVLNGPENRIRQGLELPFRRDFAVAPLTEKLIMTIDTGRFVYERDTGKYHPDYTDKTDHVSIPLPHGAQFKVIIGRMSHSSLPCGDTVVTDPADIQTALLAELGAYRQELLDTSRTDDKERLAALIWNIKFFGMGIPDASSERNYYLTDTLLPTHVIVVPQKCDEVPNVAGSVRFENNGNGLKVEPVFFERMSWESARTCSPSMVGLPIKVYASDQVAITFDKA
jgi:hypothetical protein